MTALVALPFMTLSGKVSAEPAVTIPPTAPLVESAPDGPADAVLAPPTTVPAESPSSTKTLPSPAHALSVQWFGTADCPAPLERLNELSNTSAKHPLTGSVTITESATGWHASLTLTDTPESPAAGSTERHLEGTTCQEVTDAALLVISIMQREQEREREETAAVPEPALLPAPTPAVPVNRVSPLTQKKPIPAPSSTGLARRDSGAAGYTSTELGAGASWSLWNTQVPAAGLVLTASRRGDGWAVRAQAGWSTSVTSLPTSHTTRVDFSAYEAALRGCWGPFTGLDVCAGPSLQRIEVEGLQVSAPIRSVSWFPGLSASILGSQTRAGLGLWGEAGVNVRFREIALDLRPRGRIANIERPTLFVWFGPQWRWR